MAEGLARRLARENGLDMEFRSAGVAAVDGQAISENSAVILRERGITETFTASSISGETVAWADLILTMTQDHKRLVIALHPEAVDKTFTLKEYAEEDSEVLKQIAESERYMVELQLKRALGENITEEETERVRQMEKSLPERDIKDPFGKDIEAYRLCAADIEECLKKLFRKIAK